MEKGALWFILALVLLAVVLPYFGKADICSEVNFDSAKGVCYDFRSAGGVIDRAKWNITNATGKVNVNSSGLFIGDNSDKVFSQATWFSPASYNLTIMARGAVFGDTPYVISHGVYGAAGWGAVGYINTARLDIYGDQDNGGVDEQSLADGYVVGHYDNWTMRYGVGTQRQVNFTRNSTQIGTGLAKTKNTAWNQVVGWKMDTDAVMVIEWFMAFNGSVIPQDLTTFWNRTWNITSSNTLGYGVLEDSATWTYGGQGNISRNLLSLSVTVSANSNMSCVLDNDWNYTYAVGQNVNYKAATTGTKSHAYTIYDNISVGDHCVYCSFILDDGSGKMYSSGCLDTHRISPYFRFVRQSPADLFIFSVVSTGVNVSFNISSDIGVNASMVNLSVNVNGTYADRGVSFIVNGSAFRGFRTDADAKSNKSITWDLFLDDNKVFPASYNIDEGFMEGVAHTIFPLTQQNSYASIGLLNVSLLNYGFFEVMAKSDDVLSVYYCNSTFNFGSSPASNSNCAIFGNVVGHDWNHTHNGLSNHTVLPFSVQNGTINGVGVSSSSFFMIRGAAGGGVFYIPYGSRSDHFKYSSNNGNSWTGIGGYTWDAHLHQVSNLTNLSYFACADDVAGDQNCSTVFSDTLLLSDLGPLSPDVFRPVYGFVDGSFDVNWTACQSPTNLSIVNYTVGLYDKDCGILDSFLWDGLSLNLSLNSSVYADGNYTVRVDCFDSNVKSAFGCSEAFLINNVLPSCNITYPDVGYVNVSFAWINFSFLNATICSVDTTGSNDSVSCADVSDAASPVYGVNSWFIYGFDGEGSSCFDNVTFLYNISSAGGVLGFGECMSDDWNVLIYFLIVLVALGLVYLGVIARDVMLQSFLLVLGGVAFIFFAYYFQVCVPDMFLLLWIIGVIVGLFGVFKLFYKW